MAVGSGFCLKWIILKAINENPIKEMVPMPDIVPAAIIQPKYTSATVPDSYQPFEEMLYNSVVVIKFLSVLSSTFDFSEGCSGGELHYIKYIKYSHLY